MIISWIGDQGSDDVALVGGKTANLSRFAAIGRVPPGFCVTTAAFERWAAGAGPASGSSEAELLEAAMPDAVRTELLSAYRALGEQLGVDTPSVAVRSSAVDEDGIAASFAGQHETFLNVVGADALVAAVVRCRQSAHAERAQAYRRRHGLAAGATGLAVLVQLLVCADASVVAFSVNPLTRDPDEVTVNASWGLGESVVGGTVTPDVYRLRKRDLAVIERRINDKRVMAVAAPGGTREVEVPRFLQGQPALDEAQVSEVGRLVLALEAAAGRPVDVECAFADEQLYLLQCRPVTTI